MKPLISAEPWWDVSGAAGSASGEQVRPPASRDRSGKAGQSKEDLPDEHSPQHRACKTAQPSREAA